MKRVLRLFLVFFKIGLFTFGGGYAMIAVMERELAEKKGLISHEDFLDIIGIAESSPGPLAVNSATFIGYKRGGFFGALFSTLGVILPSFIIIFTISFFFEQFLALEYVGYAFRGIQAAVAFLIISAGIKMLKHLKRNAFNCIMVSITVIAMVLLEFFAPDFSTVFLILIGGAIGLSVYLVGYFKLRNKQKNGGKE
nr:chromate transporter [Clostridia bacterium]